MDTITPGTLYGIGVGPGDPELLTLKAHRLIRSVPLVYLPVARPGQHSYARTIAAEYLDPSHQQVTELVFSLREDDERMGAQWSAHAKALAKELQRGRDAAFLTEGDPLLYSTFVHLSRALHEVGPGLPVVVVPGVSSFQAAAAAAGIPLADRQERLAVLPATYEREGLKTALEEFDTVVLLKVAGVFDRVLAQLEALKLTADAVYVARCGRPEETIVRDLRSLRGQKLDYFSLIIVRRQPQA